MGDAVWAWAPIATAPRDGRPVWVRGLDYGRGPEMHSRWAWWNGVTWIADDGSTLTYLTDWMEGPPTP